MNATDIFAPLPSDEEIQRRRAAKVADLAARSKLDLFNPINLGHWIGLCERAGVKHVPAQEIARIPLADILSFDEEPPPATVGPFWVAVQRAMAERGDNWMVRWSCCACEEVKGRLGTGRPEWHPDLVTRFMIDDFRAFELICDYPEDTVAAYARPWIKATIKDGYPVEYRVFVDHGNVAGISNYYPQRPLDNSAATLFDIVRCFLATVRLIKAQTKALNCPRMEKHWDLTKNHWTADFIRREDGEILFLEGGPPHTPSGGAHPCCFSVGEVEGIAFKASAADLERMGLTLGAGRG